MALPNAGTTGRVEQVLRPIPAPEVQLRFLQAHPKPPRQQSREQPLHLPSLHHPLLD